MMKIIAQVRWKHDKRTDGFLTPPSREKKGIDRRKPEAKACGWLLTDLALTAFGLRGLRKPKWTSH
jgi:hypothetical protein